MASILNNVVALVTLSISLAGAVPLTTSSPAADECTKGGFCVNKPEFYEEHQSIIDQKVRDLNLHLMQDRYGPERVKESYGGDDNNCHYETKTVKPYMVKSDVGDFLIVQSDLYNQTIVETNCVTKDVSSVAEKPKQCFLADERSEVTTICQETYMNMELHVYNIEKKNIESITMPVNVWCSCLVAVAYDYKK